MEKWEEDMAAVENVVHASFLIEAAKEAGIDVEKVSQCPFFIPPATKQQASQATFPCRDCLALEASMCMAKMMVKTLCKGRSPASKRVTRDRASHPSSNIYQHFCVLLLLFFCILSSVFYHSIVFDITFLTSLNY